MDEAVVVFTRKGLFKKTIKAMDIRSREHARKLWPLVSPDDRKSVTYVKPSFKGGNFKRRSHFRRVDDIRSTDLTSIFNLEEAARQKSVGQSAEHLRAKDVIAAELKRRIEMHSPMEWAYNDPDASDFPFVGDLLLGANSIETEKSIDTPFGCSFRLDLAIFGPPIKKEPVCLGGIEIEFTHEFDGRKGLIGRSIGFPLISIDISDMLLSDITPQWAALILSATTRCQQSGRRYTYVYIHELLYPYFAQIPKCVDGLQRHQFLVFGSDADIKKLEKWVAILAENLGYKWGNVAVSTVNGSNEQSRKALTTAGEIVGDGWSEMNPNRCLRITIPRPNKRDDINLLLFHITLTRLILSKINVLVGYQYKNSIQNDNIEDDIWVYHEFDFLLKQYKSRRILPKRLAEPINFIKKVIDNIKRSSSEAN